MILDAPTLLAYFDARAEGRWAVVGEIEFLADIEELVVSPFVVAELELLVREKFGREGWLAVLEELAGGAWVIAAIDGAHLRAMREVVGEGDSNDCVTSAAASIAVLAAGVAS